MHAYQKGPIIGEGTYGSVICATHKASNTQVAIKKVRLSSNGRDGVNMSVLRELKALRALACPHIVELLDTFSTKSSLVLVFEFMEWSLEDVVRDKGLDLGEGDVKAYMHMMLQALAHVHSNQAIHRDIKPDNLLISSSGQMKLADFGLARFLSLPEDDDSPDAAAPADKLTPQVFGRWYRPPELLMGSSSYSYGVDMWAAGCVFAELLLRKPWFPGNCDMDQLDRIFKMLGVPTPETWPGYADLPHRIDFKPAPGQPLQQVFKQASPQALDLLQRLMAYDPDQRISAAQALAHPYFASQPAPTPTAQLPKPASTRLNRLGLSRVPAVIPDMLMPHRLLQQQQQGFATAGIAAAGWADAGEAGEALPMQQQQLLLHRQDAGQAAAAGGAAARPSGQNGSSTSRLLAFSDAPSFSGRFLGLGALPAQQQQQEQNAVQPPAHQLQGHQQQAGGLQRPSVHFAADVVGLEQEQEVVPWKGRLSFSGILDEPSAPAEGSEAAAAVATRGGVGAGAAAVPGGDENAMPAAAQQQQQQQHVYRRPSPIAGSSQQQQQQHTKGGQHNTTSSNQRPPLHPNATPVHLRTAQHTGNAAAAGSGDDKVQGQPQQQQLRQGGSTVAGGGGADVQGGQLGARQRRGVSDLSAALTSAAAAGGQVGAAGLLNPLAPLLGMPRIGLQQQQQQQPLAGLPATDNPVHSQQQQQQQQGVHNSILSSTPAAAAAGARRTPEATTGDEGAAADADGDTACPMSLGTSARKRSRTVFESVPGGAAAGGAAGDQQQQQHQGQQDGAGDVSMVPSTDRRTVRSRRSSINSGCCSMETDTADGQQQQHNQQQDQQQQHHQQQQGHTILAAAAAAGGGGGGLVPQPMGQLSADDRSMSITSECVHNALLSAAQQHQQQLLHPLPPQHHHQQQQHQRELQLTADMPPPHAVQPRGVSAAAAGGTQPHQPAWPAAGGNNQQPHPLLGGAHHGAGGSSNDSKAAPGSDDGSKACPMSLDHRAARHHQQQQQQQQGVHHQAPSSQQHQQDGASAQPHSVSGSDGQQHHNHNPAAAAAAAGAGASGGTSAAAAAEGLSSGDLVTGGRPAANELRSMDPAELAELAKFWRPRLDSAERRYLRCRTMQLGEALLQASQPDDEEGPEYHHFPGMMDNSPPTGGHGLFDTPAKGPDSAGHLLEQQQGQQQGQVHFGGILAPQQQEQEGQGQVQVQQGRDSMDAAGGLPSDSFLSPTDNNTAAAAGAAAAAGQLVGQEAVAAATTTTPPVTAV